MTRSRLITRRRAIVAGLASVGGLVLARAPKELPPTYGNLLRGGRHADLRGAPRLLPASRSPASTRVGNHVVPSHRHDQPGDQREVAARRGYGRLQAGAFADWRLSVEGRVARPHAFSLAELKELRRGARSRGTSARKAGRRSRSGPVAVGVVLRPSASCHRRVSPSAAPWTTGWTASICSMRCTRRPCSPTA